MPAYPVPERLRRARATKVCTPNLCLNRVRRWIGVGPRYASARKAWEAVPRSARQTSRTIPPGVPVWLDRPAGTRFGHIVLSMGPDDHGHPLVCSTDYPSRGRVSVVRLDELERRWGMRMLGWAHTLNGYRV